MANTPRFTNAVAQSLATDFLASLDAGTAAIIEIYTGTQPAQADDGVGGATKLATLTCSATAGVVSDGNPGGLLTFSSITGDSSADATGTAAWARILTQSAGTTIMDCSVGTAGADINFNTVSFTAGSAVDITSLTITFPES